MTLEDTYTVACASMPGQGAWDSGLGAGTPGSG